MKANYTKFHLVAILTEEDLTRLVEDTRLIGKPLFPGKDAQNFGVWLSDEEGAKQDFDIDGIHQIVGEEGYDLLLTTEAYERLKDQGYVGRYIFGFGRVDVFTEKNPSAEYVFNNNQ
jgi:hypothetical protein